MKKFIFPVLIFLSVCASAQDGGFFSSDDVLAAAIPARRTVPQNAQRLTPDNSWQPATGAQYPVFKKAAPNSKSYGGGIGEPTTSLEFNYLYQTADFYWKNRSLSRLTWRDVALRGGELKLRTQLTGGQDFIAGASYVTSASGYSTDDDLDNMALIVSWGSVDVSETSVYMFWSVAKADSATAFLGLRFKHGSYNMRQQYMLDYTGAWLLPVSGDTQEYAFNTFGPSLGFDADILKNANFRFSAGGDLGVQLYYAVANWPYRDDLAHPNSFDDLGFVVNLNAAFKLEWMLSRNFSLTGSLGLDYFRNPFAMSRTVHGVYQDVGDHLQQVIYSNLKTSLGVKISF